MSEIEAALDERLARLRARMLEDAALASAAADRKAAGEPPPVCSQCGTPLQARGGHPRQLQTHGGQNVTLQREDGVCPACQTGLFPPG